MAFLNEVDKALDKGRDINMVLTEVTVPSFSTQIANAAVDGLQDTASMTINELFDKTEDMLKELTKFTSGVDKLASLTDTIVKGMSSPLFQSMVVLASMIPDGISYCKSMREKCDGLSNSWKQLAKAMKDKSNKAVVDTYYEILTQTEDVGCQLVNSVLLLALQKIYDMIDEQVQKATGYSVVQLYFFYIEGRQFYEQYKYYRKMYKNMGEGNGTVTLEFGVADYKQMYEKYKKLFIVWCNSKSDAIFNGSMIMLMKDELMRLKNCFEQFTNMNLETATGKIEDIDHFISLLDELGITTDQPIDDPLSNAIGSVSNLLAMSINGYNNVLQQFQNMKEDAKEMANNMTTGIMTESMQGLSVSARVGYKVAVLIQDMSIGSLVIDLNKDPNDEKIAAILINQLKAAGNLSNGTINQLVKFCQDTWTAGETAKQLKVATTDRPVMYLTFTVSCNYSGKYEAEEEDTEEEPSDEIHLKTPVDYLTSLTIEEESKHPLERKHNALPLLISLIQIIKPVLPGLKTICHLVENYKINKQVMEANSKGNIGYAIATIMDIADKIKNMGKKKEPTNYCTGELGEGDVNLYTIRTSECARRISAVMGYDESNIPTTGIYRIDASKTKELVDILNKDGKPTTMIDATKISDIVFAIGNDGAGGYSGDYPDGSYQGLYFEFDPYSGSMYVPTPGVPDLASEILECKRKGMQPAFEYTVDDYYIMNPDEDLDVETEESYNSDVDLLEEELHDVMQMEDANPAVIADLQNRLKAAQDQEKIDEEEKRKAKERERIFEELKGTLECVTDEAEGQQAIDLDKIRACNLNIDKLYPLPNPNGVKTFSEASKIMDEVTAAITREKNPDGTTKVFPDESKLNEKLKQEDVHNDTTLQCKGNHAIVEFGQMCITNDEVPYELNVVPGQSLNMSTHIGRVKQYDLMRPLESIFKYGTIRKETKDDGSVDFARAFKDHTHRHFIVDDFETSWREPINFDVMQEISQVMKKSNGIFTFIVDNLCYSILPNILVRRKTYWPFSGPNGYSDTYDDWVEHVDKTIDNFYKGVQSNMSADKIKKTNGSQYKLKAIADEGLQYREDFIHGKHKWGTKEMGIVDLYLNYKDNRDKCDSYKQSPLRGLGVTYYPDLLSRIDLIDDIDYNKEYYNLISDIITRRNQSESVSASQIKNLCEKAWKDFLSSECKDTYRLDGNCWSITAKLDEAFRGEYEVNDLYQWIRDKQKTKTTWVEKREVVDNKIATTKEEVEERENKDDKIRRIVNLYIYYRNYRNNHPEFNYSNDDNSNDDNSVDFDTSGYDPSTGIFNSDTSALALIAEEKAKLEAFWSKVIAEEKSEWNMETAIKRIKKICEEAQVEAEWPTPMPIDLDGETYDLYEFYELDASVNGGDGGLNDMGDELDFGDVDWNGNLDVPTDPESLNPDQNAAEDRLNDKLAEDMRNKTAVEYTQYKYWIRYFSMMSMFNLLPIYWATGLIFLGVPVLLPAVFIPFAVIHIKAARQIVVVGMSIRGIWVDPIIMTINCSADFSTILSPLLMTLNMVKQTYYNMINRIEMCIPNLGVGLINMLKSENKRLEKENFYLNETVLPTLKAIKFPGKAEVMAEIEQKFDSYDIRQKVMRLEQMAVENFGGYADLFNKKDEVGDMETKPSDEMDEIKDDASKQNDGSQTDTSTNTSNKNDNDATNKNEIIDSSTGTIDENA